MHDIGGEQTVKGNFAEELSNPPYEFQLDEQPAASISIGCMESDNGGPVLIIQPPWAK